MSQLPSMPLWINDFFSKTDHLSFDEQMAYLKLMMKTWVRNCEALPDDDRVIARVLGLGLKRWRAIRPQIEPFFDLSEHTWHQKKLKNHFLNASNRHESYASRGSAGGKAKSNKIKDVTNEEALAQLEHQLKPGSTSQYQRVDTPRPLQDRGGYLPVAEPQQNQSQSHAADSAASLRGGDAAAAKKPPPSQHPEPHPDRPPPTPEEIARLTQTVTNALRPQPTEGPTDLAERQALVASWLKQLEIPPDTPQNGAPTNPNDPISH